MDVPHHQDNHHITESHFHTLASSLDVLNLAVEWHWMYWHGTGIHVDVDDDFPTLFLILVVSGCDSFILVH